MLFWVFIYAMVGALAGLAMNAASSEEPRVDSMGGVFLFLLVWPYFLIKFLKSLKNRSI
jgi:hypothetical protein